VMMKGFILICLFICLVLDVATCSVTFAIDFQAPTTPLPHYWEECVGSGHATLALRHDYQVHLTQCARELGLKSVRFHGLFDDDMSVYSYNSATKQAQYSWFNVDEIFDFLLSIRMKPYVELSFMPEQLASGPTTVFHYKGNVTPPKNYTLWDGLISAFAKHIIDRYTLAEVSTWSFEVWNEPNLNGFWAANQAAYFELYAHTARALKSVSGSLKVGGPATAASSWISDFINYCKTNNAPFDFVSTHQYPTDENPITRDGFIKALQGTRKTVGDKTPLYYSEFNDGLWGSTTYHDAPYASAFLFKTVHDLKGVVDILSWWTFTDIFEEGGQTSQPFFSGNGWGLLNIYKIEKPIYRAFQILHSLGTKEVAVVSKDSAGSTVGAWAAIGSTGQTLDILVYNYDVPNAAIKNETVSIQINNLQNIPIYGFIEWIDDTHANAPALWRKLGSPEYPKQPVLDQLSTASRLVRDTILAKKLSNSAIQFDLGITTWGVARISIPI